jgi:hypothetical protein
VDLQTGWLVPKQRFRTPRGFWPASPSFTGIKKTVNPRGICIPVPVRDSSCLSSFSWNRHMESSKMSLEYRKIGEPNFLFFTKMKF